MTKMAGVTTFSRVDRRELPLFRLPGRDGEPRGTLDHWQRRDMLVALVHSSSCSECRELREELRRRRDRFSADQVSVIEVALSPPGGDPGLLEDPQGQVAAQLASAVGAPAGSPLLLVATRFARIAAALDPHRTPAATLVDRAMEEMNLAQTQCEDCSLPLDWDER